MKRFFGFYKNRYKISAKRKKFSNKIFLKSLLYIKIDEKKIWAFLDPLSEKAGARNKKKTLKMANFRPKTGKI